MTLPNIPEMARGIRNAGSDTKNNYKKLRLAMMSFVDEGYWREFDCIGEHWEFDSFAQFCDEWIQFPLEKLKKLFAGEKDVLAVINSAELNPSGDKSVRQIAEETGKSKSQAHSEVSGLNRTGRKVIQYNITQYTKPETAAAKIHEKFGADFAQQLKEAL
jgi:hypothetical protein